MLKANATVMHLGKIEMVNVGSSPIRRPRIAVEYKENVDATAIDVKISAACLFTSWNSQQHKLIIRQGHKRGEQIRANYLAS
jgi:hypothetical protein